MSRPEQLTMLLECHRVMRELYPEPERALYALLQWARKELPTILPYEQVDTFNCVTVTESMYEALKRTFDHDLLRASVWDWWGELALALSLPSWVPYRHKPETVRQVLAGCLPASLPTDVLFDPRCGTGRLFLVAHQLGWRGVYYGVETNTKAYRLCLLNIATYGLPAFVVSTPTPPELDHPNWQKHNVWASISPSVLQPHTCRPCSAPTGQIDGQ